MEVDLSAGYKGRILVLVAVKGCFSVNEQRQVISKLVEVDEPPAVGANRGVFHGFRMVFAWF